MDGSEFDDDGDITPSMRRWQFAGLSLCQQYDELDRVQPQQAIGIGGEKKLYF